MIKENEYIRTDLGEIAKVTYVAKESLQDIVGEVEGIDRQIGFCNTEPYVRGNIVKHSKNIIDLIEAEDIIEINKEKYEVIYDESLDKLGVLIPNRNYLGIRHSALEHIFKKYENISILTKEQYMKNCYLVERKKEC